MEWGRFRKYTRRIRWLNEFDTLNSLKSDGRINGYNVPKPVSQLVIDCCFQNGPCDQSKHSPKIPRRFPIDRGIRWSGLQTVQPMQSIGCHWVGDFIAPGVASGFNQAGDHLQRGRLAATVPWGNAREAEVCRVLPSIQANWRFPETFEKAALSSSIRNAFSEFWHL